ncbi:MAG: tetratricopeptide repeat protein [Bacteroidota bacterium]
MENALSQIENDSLKVEYLNKLCWDFRNKDPEFSVKVGKKAIEIGTSCGYSDEMLKAMSFTGVAYRNQGNYPEAFRYFFDHLEASKKLGNLEQQGYANINIGNLYIYQGKADDAIIMLSDALKITQDLKNDNMSAYTMLNIGRAFLLKKDYTKALDFFTQAFDFRKIQNDLDGQGICHKYKGDTYFEMGEFDKAYDEYHNALNIVRLDKDQDLYSDLLNRLAHIYLEKNQLKKALLTAKQSFIIGSDIGAKLRIKESAQTISLIYQKTGDYKKAYEYQSVYIDYKDSLFNDDVSNRIADIKFEIERQKKQVEYELEQQKKQSEINLLTEQKSKQRAINTGLIVFLFLVALLVVLMFRTNRIRKKTNRLLIMQKNEIQVKNDELQYANIEIQKRTDEILLQKEEIEAQHDEISAQRDLANEQRDLITEKNNEIKDSIRYAKRIQNAILPREELLKEHVNDFFIIFKPRDIVSGDFYWYTIIENHLIIAAADCTGHGVPGAFMSMLGTAFLKEIIVNEYVTHPGVILRKLRKEIIKSLQQQGEAGEQKDGMDISLCSINLETMVCQFSGANNPLYIVSKNINIPDSDFKKVYSDPETNLELIEIKGDKMPIAIYIKMDRFTTHEFQLSKGDKLYMFSDGYPDQFGGPLGKKLKYLQFKKILLANSEKPMDEQKLELDNAFINWIESKNPTGLPYEQVDDIVILGIEI